MKTVQHASTIINYKGKLCEVVGIAHEKVLFIREVGAKQCERCGVTKEYCEVESSPNFQENAKAVATLVEV